jgi:hypothetical protein
MHIRVASFCKPERGESSGPALWSVALAAKEVLNVL